MRGFIGNSPPPYFFISAPNISFTRTCQCRRILKSRAIPPFFYLYDIRRMRKYLDKKSLLTLVHAFITSRLDYCNSLLYRLPNTAISKLQRVQNAAARLVTFSYKFSHVTPALCNFSKVSICLSAAILGRC